MNHSKEQPFLATLKERKRLTTPTSPKETHHLVLDLGGSGLAYEAGDCIGILPTNPADIVKKTLKSMNATGTETIIKRDEESTLHHFLTHKANISQPSRGFIRLLAQHYPDLSPLLQRENRADFDHFVEKYELWDLLTYHPTSLTPQQICDKLTALMPRFYSIASSMRAVGEEVHLTVRHVGYTARDIHRYGICTHYLCDQAPLAKPHIPLFIQPADHFRLPADDKTPIIMIGPGTGIAPYRAFMQERIARGAPGKNWLFFGEWTRQGHFFYQDDWLELEKAGKLRLSLAFSRDQEHKVYVQDKMREEADHLWQWVQNGAYIYVCGDAKNMAPAVEQALLDTIQGPDPKAYLRNLRKAGRYLRDVY